MAGNPGAITNEHWSTDFGEIGCIDIVLARVERDVATYVDIRSKRESASSVQEALCIADNAMLTDNDALRTVKLGSPVDAARSLAGRRTARR